MLSDREPKGAATRHVPRPPASPVHVGAAEARMLDETDDRGFGGDSPMPMVLS